MDNQIFGLDLCSIQGKVDWAKVKASGVQFAYIKCGQYSNTPDWSFHDYIQGAKDAGLAVGAYWFCTQQTNAADQVKRFFEYASLHNTHAIGQEAGELPPMLDWEFCKGLPGPACVDWLAEAAPAATELWYGRANDRVMAGGEGWVRRPTIYTYPWFASSHQPWLKMKPELGTYPLTWAAYASKGPNLIPWDVDTTRGPEQLGQAYIIPKPWDTWTLWQWSGNKGKRIPGIAGDVDRELFNGSAGEWDQFRGILRQVDSIEGEVKE